MKLPLLFIFFINSLVNCGILYPKYSATRQFISLDGLWKFSLSTNGSFDNNDALTNGEDRDLHLMPVPSSYNDILTTLEGRDNFGPVKYERTFYISEEWLESGDRLFIRFGSVCYSAQVSINGKHALSHAIGHLAFQGEITTFLVNGLNTVTVIADNTLDAYSMPQGSQQEVPGGRIKQTYTFDYFNYAGIDRSVHVYSVPKIFITDVIVTTTVNINKNSGVVNYIIGVSGDSSNIGGNIVVTVVDANENEVVSKTDYVDNLANGYNSSLEIQNATFWWPYLMNDIPGYLYSMRIELKNNGLIDQYDQTFGIRELTWNNDSFLINGKPIYFQGVGRHEDSDIRGKGVDLPLIARDYNLLRWLGVNCFRTSNYPYAEEIMDLADSLGIMVINELPAANTHDYNNVLLENHKHAITDLYKRDQNRPSVVMWSLANQPDTKDTKSLEYYEHIAAHIRVYDHSRPISFTMSYDSGEDVAGHAVDIICFNKYEGWYLWTGDVDAILSQIVKVAQDWRTKQNKLVMLTEYGADSVEGTHLLPSNVWSEEFQLDLMSKYFEAFDQLRAKGWFIGEMIWSYADFKTHQDVTKVGGNRKGIFTRQRQPKAAAHFLRSRYWALAHELYNVTLPDDLYRYVTTKRHA